MLLYINHVIYSLVLAFLDFHGAVYISTSVILSRCCVDHTSTTWNSLLSVHFCFFLVHSVPSLQISIKFYSQIFNVSCYLKREDDVQYSNVVEKCFILDSDFYVFGCNV